MLNTIRHDELFNKDLYNLDTHIIGLGGVGSHAAYLLGKLGVGTHNKVVFWDGDTVEAHNPANQMYAPSHIGFKKVTAIAKQFTAWTDGLDPQRRPTMVSRPVKLSGATFLCLDSMTARKSILRQSIWGNAKVSFVIETRMNDSQIFVFCMDPNNDRHVAIWEAYSDYSDDEADAVAACGGVVSIISTVNLNAVFAVQSFLDCVANDCSAEGVVNRFGMDIKTREILAADIW